MLDAARRSGAMHGYAETEVFAPCVVKARETIEHGGVGRVLWVRSRESHSGPHSPHFWDVEKTGGGAMNDLGCHSIEAARYFFGKEDKIVEVMAWGARLVHGDKTKGEDNALLLLKFSSGGIGHCELSWTTKGGLDLRNEIHGSEGSIFTDVTRGTPIAGFTPEPAGYVVEKADIDFGWTRPAARGSVRLRLSGRDAPFRRVRPRRRDAARDIRGRVHRELHSRCRLRIDASKSRWVKVRT